MAAKSRDHADAQHISRQARTSYDNHRLHERCLSICMVGTVHLDSAIPVAAGCAGRAWAQHRANFRSGPSSCRLALLLGYLSFGYLADILGRKRIYIGFLTGRCRAGSSLCAHAQPASVVALRPYRRIFRNRFLQRLHHHCQRGLSPPLFAARRWAWSTTSADFSGAGAPYLIGYITEISGIELALSSISIAFLVAAIIAMGLHETKSHALTLANPPRQIPRFAYLALQAIILWEN